MNYFRILRPINVFIVLLTLVATSYYLNNNFSFLSIEFIVVSATYVCLVGSGNVINDYFDVEADKINKPNKQFVGNKLTIQQTVIYYWILVLLSILGAVYLGFTFRSIDLPLLIIGSLIVLWLYSAVLKKLFIIGNSVVALLTVTVFYAAIFLYLLQQGKELTFLKTLRDHYLGLTVNQVVWMLTGLTFIQNFAREIIKDVEDLPGDKFIGAFTLPMLVGKSSTIWLVRLLMLIFPVSYFFYSYTASIEWLSKGVYFLSIGAFLQLFSIVYSFFLQEKKAVVWLKNTLKLSMLFILLYFFIT